jgi:hypothetical protein
VESGLVCLDAFHTNDKKTVQLAIKTKTVILSNKYKKSVPLFSK